MDSKLKITASTVISSTRLKLLCNQYHYDICHNEKRHLPKIRIRYVEDNGKFDYAEFGDFFFSDDNLYVWKQEEEYADRHNADVVEDHFIKKCTRTGYACRFLYVGVDTNFTDSNGEHIFVGDVLELKDGFRETQLALGYFPYYDNEEMTYCFVLDNHFLSLQSCIDRKDLSITRIGTVYFQLDWNFSTEDMNGKVRNFNGWHDSNKDHNDKVFMARYTPNFDQELWKYYGLEILGIEYKI